MVGPEGDTSGETLDDAEAFKVCQRLYYQALLGFGIDPDEDPDEVMVVYSREDEYESRGDRQVKLVRTGNSYTVYEEAMLANVVWEHSVDPDRIYPDPVFASRAFGPDQAKRKVLARLQATADSHTVSITKSLRSRRKPATSTDDQQAN